MWRYFSYKKNNVYPDVLQELIDIYNNTYHRTIKTKPILVTPKNEAKVWKIIYGYDKDSGYTPNWTREIFIIDKVLYKNPPAYKIRDLNDEVVKGKFYEQELQKIDKKKKKFIQLNKC
ncbi:unnamed protein product [Brachionus calyciflorus]|uniref:Uncharacterized protein n=1 Tax=Brachionus calyciflorus TaxID=104777 RepID=A0A814NA55_9BILA|nr:unnamed protein product [Brachionus calyciflorus]